MSIPVIAPFQKAYVSSEGLVDAVDVDNNNADQTGILSGTTDLQSVLNRIDGTGLGLDTTTFAGDFSATASNISTWFNGLARIHLLGEDNQADAIRAFTLPGATVLNTLFDDLSAKGLAEVFELEVSYLGGPSTTTSENNIKIGPRVAPAPQIEGTTGVTLSRGESVTFRIRRAASVLSNYEIVSEDQITTISADPLNDIELQTVNWDAGTGTLPTNVQRGYAFEVVNAPADDSGRLGETMRNEDWVVWVGDPFVSGTNDWETEPHEWIVIASHDVRRLTLIGQNFLNTVSEVDRRADAAFAESETTDALVWLSPAALVTAPFLVPSSDTDNPRTPETVAYIGGRENRNADEQFTFNQSYPTSFLYVGITPNYITANTEANIDIVIKDADGIEARRFNLADDFRLIDDDTFTNNTVRHYVYNNGGPADETSLNYNPNEVIEIVRVETQRGFTLNSDSVDVTQNVDDIAENQLDLNVQAKLNAKGTLNHVDRERLDDIETTDTTASVDSTLTFKYRYGAGSTNLGDYIDGNNNDDLIPDLVNRDVVILVDDSVDLTTVGSDALTLQIPSLIEGYNTYKGTVSASTDPLNDIRALSGTVNTRTPDGLAPNIKIDTDNLDQSVRDLIGNREAWASIAEVLFNGATVRDIIAADEVRYDPGYSKGVDWRDMEDSTTINENRYIDDDLTITSSTISFELSGFDAAHEKIIGVGLQLNTGSTSYGALVEMGSAIQFISVDENNHVQINTTPGSGTVTNVAVSGQNGALSLVDGAANFLLFEIVPHPTISGRYRIVPVLYDGTTYYRCNDIDYTPSGVSTGAAFGFSRSTAQRGQITRFSVIESPNYITHAGLSSRLQHSLADKWNFGFATLVEGSTIREVVFQTRLGSQGNDVANIVRADGVPTVTPDFSGQIYIDETNKNAYISTDNTGSGDWAGPVGG